MFHTDSPVPSLQSATMKTLFLLRHAKSSWDDPDLKDFERPLNERGKQDIPVMVSRFQQGHGSVDSIICSPANRAKTTAHKFAELLGFPEADVISNPELYFAGTGMFLKAAASADDDCEKLLLVGHNPAITEFANVMADEHIDNIPTCGLVELSVPIENWSDIELHSATLVSFDFPKRDSESD